MILARQQHGRIVELLLAATDTVSSSRRGYVEVCDLAHQPAVRRRHCRRDRAKT